MDQNNTHRRGSGFYVLASQAAGWGSVAAFGLAFGNKIMGREWLFSPSDLLQAALYLVLFAIFASMAAISTRS